MKADTPHAHLGTGDASTLPNRPARSGLSGRSVLQWILMGTLSLVIFLIDLLTPLSVADGMLYVVVVMIFGLRGNNPPFPLWVAGGCSILTLLGYHLSPEGEVWWGAIWNRGLALLVIWVTAFTCRTQLLNTLKTMNQPGPMRFSEETNLLGPTPAPKDRLSKLEGGQTPGSSVSNSPVSGEHAVLLLNESINEPFHKDFQDLVDSLEGIVWEAEFPSYRFTFVSLQAERLLGYPREKWLTEPAFFPNHIHEADRQRTIEACRAKTLLKENHELEYRFLHADGSILWIRDLVTVVVEQDHPVKVRGVMFDMTSFKTAEDALKKSEERFRKYFATGLVGMAITSPHKTFLEVNDRFCSMLGYSREELKHITWDTLTHPDDLPGDESRFEQLVAGHLESYSMEKRFLRKDGRLIHANLYVNAVRDTSGTVEYLTGMVEDITQQREAEHASHAAERLTDTILENLPNMVFVKDARDLRFVRFNQAGERLLGYSREDLIGKNDFDFFPGEEATFFTAKDRAVLAEGTLLDIPEEPIHTRNKGIRILHTKKLPIFDEAGVPRFLLGISEDITEQKQMEDALRASQSTLKNLFDSAPIMMGVLEVTGDDLRHISDTKATGEFLGIPLNQLTGQWCSRFTPPEILRIWLTHSHACFQTGQAVSFEYSHPHPQGERWVAVTVTPLPHTASTGLKCAYVAQDMTERKRMEDQIRRHAEQLEGEVARRTSRIQELEQRRMHMEKLATLAQVSAGLAHEINNPLASIAQSLLVLKRAIPADHPKYKYTEKMQNCIERMTLTIEQFYKLYRPAPPKVDPVDVEWVIRSAVDIMQAVAGKKGLSLTTSFALTTSRVAIAPGDLIQVLCNLIHNAMDASCPPSEILVSAAHAPHTVTISVTDFGMGIPPNVLDRMFDPFFTTKYGEAGAGLGLGLAVSKNLVESMGGRIQCSTTEGMGTTFSLVFPLYGASREPS